MNHVSTVCTHCADGCKVTLGVRQTHEGSEIVRADNRDKSGINGDFLCAKGRFGFDFVDSPERLTKPLVRNPAGKLEATTWEQALKVAASKLKEVRDSRGGEAIGVLGSNCTTNEENYLLQKFARTILLTNNIDHHRTADHATFARAMAGSEGKTAGLREVGTACAILLVGGNPTEEHPLLAWQLRTNVRLNKARLYVVNHQTIKLERQAKCVQGVPPNGYRDLTALLDKNEGDFAKAVMAEESLLIIFGQEFRGSRLRLAAWGLKAAMGLRASAIMRVARRG
jgi:NADH-quinone oxidoreductase subunit G